MCTLVLRWRPDEAFSVQLLALRDELAGRAFDLPGAWWPDQPGVIGGRDRAAGGSWCVSDPATAVTAVVLNRPERRLAEPGAASRGVLPLLAVRHGEDWAGHVELAGMAGFNLVLISPQALAWWSFDGTNLSRDSLAPGLHMFTPRGLIDTDERFARGRARIEPDPHAATDVVWADWLAVVRASVPSADPGALIVRHPIGADSYETVFGQFIAARPGVLRLDYLNHPARERSGEWTSTLWPQRSGRRRDADD